MPDVVSAGTVAAVVPEAVWAVDAEAGDVVFAVASGVVPVTSGGAAVSEGGGSVSAVVSRKCSRQ